MLILLQIVAYKEGRENQGQDNVDKIFYWEPAKKCHKVFQRRKIIRPFEISVFWQNLVVLVKNIDSAVPRDSRTKDKEKWKKKIKPESCKNLVM